MTGWVDAFNFFGASLVAVFLLNRFFPCALHLQRIDRQGFYVITIKDKRRSQPEMEKLNPMNPNNSTNPGNTTHSLDAHA